MIGAYHLIKINLYGQPIYFVFRTKPDYTECFIAHLFTSPFRNLLRVIMTMTTWKLWRALHDPPLNHPVFELVTAAPPIQARSYVNLIAPVGLVILGILFAIGVLKLPQTILPLLFNPIFDLIVGILLFTGTVYGFVWAANISQIIARIRNEGKYDLLCLSPSGKLRISWAICTGYLYRNQSFARVHGQRTRIVQALLMIPGALILPLFIGMAASKQAYVLMVLSTVVHIVTLAAAFYVDYIQSAVMGSLVGMNIPNYTRSELDARLLAAGGFLTFQASTYLIAWAIGFGALSDIYTNLNIDGFAELSLPIVRLIVFYLSREIMIFGLWHLLTRQLQARINEVDLTLAR